MVDSSRQENTNTLLPAGLEDLLAPQAAFEAKVIEQILDELARWGYHRVKPPLLEFESTLLEGPGQTVADATFRLMDPVSHRMLGLRADITPQIARIARSRLAGQARPLRLCYAGQILRIQGTQLRPARQFAQVGAEVFDDNSHTADGEVMSAAVSCLKHIGVEGISLDITHPRLISLLCPVLGVDEAAIRPAMDRKDSAALKSLLTSAQYSFFKTLLDACGPYEEALAHFLDLSFPARVQDELVRLRNVIRQLHDVVPDIPITLDLVERRGFEYQTGVSFSLYAVGAKDEIGRGGRYEVAGINKPAGLMADQTSAGGLSATGFTLFMDSLLSVAKAKKVPPKLYVPYKEGPKVAARLRDKGWAVIAGFSDHPDAKAAARAQGCTHLYQDEKIISV